MSSSSWWETSTPRYRVTLPLAPSHSSFLPPPPRGGEHCGIVQLLPPPLPPRTLPRAGSRFTRTAAARGRERRGGLGGGGRARARASEGVCVRGVTEGNGRGRPATTRHGSQRPRRAGPVAA